MKPFALFALIVTAPLTLWTPTASAGVAAELAEWMIRQGAKFADDVAGKGAKELASELEPLGARVGGDVLEQAVKRGGPGSLKLLRGLGDQAPDAARLIAGHGAAGKLLVEKGGTVAVDAFREFGDDGIRVQVREGASEGGQMLAVYGRVLAESADKLSAESFAHLRHWTPQVKGASSEWTGAFGEKLKQGGDDFVIWVSKRWKAVAVTGGLTIAAITAYKVGDGIATAIPNPSRDPIGWITWWMPALILVVILAAAWVARHSIATWLKARSQKPIAVANQMSDHSLNPKFGGESEFAAPATRIQPPHQEVPPDGLD